MESNTESNVKWKISQYREHNMYCNRKQNPIWNQKQNSTQNRIYIIEHRIESRIEHKQNMEQNMEKNTKWNLEQTTYMGGPGPQAKDDDLF